jgi:predicted TIM-barrel fold metal-dependent hydrolase
MISKLGVEVIDAHAHFMTYDTVRMFLDRGTTLDRLEQRARSLTDMKEFQIPEEGWDTGRLWAEELDRYGITSIGFMVGPESWEEFLEARKRFPGYFMGYANVDPASPDAVELVKRAGRDGFQGIKLYPSSWPQLRASSEEVYHIYEEALKQGLLVILHFGITIGTSANLASGNPLDIQVPAQEYPDLNFMIAHFGAGFFREVLMLQYQTENVCIDTSGSNSWMRFQPLDLDIMRLFEKAVKAAGTERIVFGSDSSFFPRGYRFNILEEQFHSVKALCSRTSLCLTDEQVDQIFSGNILRLTNFEPRTS